MYDIYDFYKSHNGQRINNVLINQINNLKLETFGKRVLEIGFPLFEQSFKEKGAERVISAVIPKFADAAIKAKKDGCSNVVITNDYLLPFSNCFFDIIILNHSLEHSLAHEKLLKEVWRILADGGNLITITPSAFNVWRFVKKSHYYQTNALFKFSINNILKNLKFTIKDIRTFNSFPKKFVLCQAQKKVFSAILSSSSKTENAPNNKYAVATNWSSNFKE